MHRKVRKSVIFDTKSNFVMFVVLIYSHYMKLYREILDKLVRLKDADDRKPILLMGARQIGKSWVMEEYGRQCFTYCARFDFDRQPELKSVFRMTKEPERIIKELALYCDVPILPGETLLIFDEIQECEEALNSLKYFCEDAPQYHIIAAGSLLGVAVKRKHMSVPVGKLRILRMYPMTFREFLCSSDSKTFSYIESLDTVGALPLVILDKINSEYRRYQVCGGMPEAVAALLGNRGTAEVEARLQDIIDLYELDFSKYADTKEIPRINAIWKSLPAQLAKENRKFIYKVIRTGARSKDYEDALMWLENAGLIYRVFNVSKPGIPLSAYEESDAFKVYACDCGILRRLARLPVDIVLSPVANYTEFKGAMAENVVLQSMLPELDDDMPAYWSSAATAEVEFLVQWGEDVIPVEVKASDNIAGNSLAVYTKKFNPRYRIRFSMRNMQFNCGLLSAPSPLSAWIDKLCMMLPSAISLVSEK